MAENRKSKSMPVSITASPGPSKSKSFSQQNSELGAMPTENQVQPQKKRSLNFKRVFHAIKKKCHITDQTEIPRSVTDLFTDLKEHKRVISEVMNAVRCVIQMNPEYNASEYYGLLDFECPLKKDPYEILAEVLKAGKGTDFEKYEKFDKVLEITDHLTKSNRQFHRDVPAAFPNISRFLQTDFPNAESNMKDLEKLRDEMDFAAVEAKKKINDPGVLEMRVNNAKRATDSYEHMCTELEALLQTMAKTKDNHVEDLMRWMDLQRVYYKKMDNVIKF